MNGITVSKNAASIIFDQLKDIQSNIPTPSDALKEPGKEGNSFSSFLKESVTEVNQSQISSDKMATNLAAGKSENIHETMLMATKAELSFNLMVQIRNKALEAYSEIMRMPV
jgi:flagellar hook-basal body complex protein FliE